MQKVVFNFDSNNHIYGAYYKNASDEYYSNIFYHQELQNLIIHLSEKSINKCELVGHTLKIYYDNRIIYLRNIEELSSVRSFAPLISKVNDYITKQNMRKGFSERRYAKRKSKVGKTAVSALLALLLIVPTVSSLLAKAEKEAPELNEQSYSETITNYEPEQLIALSELNSKKISSEATELVNSINMNFSSRLDTSKAQNTRDNYAELITKTAKTFGVDPNVMIAMATQEKGEHSREIDPDGGVGLMQIQYSVWIDQDLTAYDYDTNKLITIHIDDQNIRDLETNIKIACMIFQGNLKDMHYNLPASLQAYNWGATGAKKILSTYAIETNQTLDEVLDNYADTTWLNRFGEYIYADLVLSYFDTSENISNLKRDQDNNISTINYHINNENNNTLYY